MATMRFLALETATRRLSAALWIDGAVSEQSLDSMNGGSEWLLPAVRTLLADSGTRLIDLDGIAFDCGPGAFTGLRLAAGCAQGLAFGLDLPVLGVCSLQALAMASGRNKVFACLDARMNEVYSAAYLNGTEVYGPSVTPPGAVPLPPGDGWVGCGDGFAAYRDLLPKFSCVYEHVLPTAAAVAALAASRFACGEAGLAADAVPLYVRDKVALTTAERLARGGVR
jgi:tRNA threonylcarbamoyladenosine biosynthesis protein TsaB